MFPIVIPTPSLSPRQGTSAGSETLTVVTAWEGGAVTGIQWVETRDAAKFILQCAG